MKKKMVFLVFTLVIFLLAVFIFLGSHQKTKLDKNIKKILEKNLQVQSFTAESSLYNKKGLKTGKTIFKFSPKGWQMTIKDININNQELESSSWLKIDNTFYIKDYQDGYWWKKPKEEIDKEPEILSVIDYRDYLKQLQEKERQDEISLQFLKKELCTDRYCWQYEVIDKTIQFPGRDKLNHYIWFDEDEYLLRKEEYLTGGGDLSLTFYSQHNTSQLEKPERLTPPEKTKKAPHDVSIFMLPGTIRVTTSLPDNSPVPPIIPLILKKE